MTLFYWASWWSIILKKMEKRLAPVLSLVWYGKGNGRFVVAFHLTQLAFNCLMTVITYWSQSISRMSKAVKQVHVQANCLLSAFFLGSVMWQRSCQLYLLLAQNLHQLSVSFFGNSNGGFWIKAWVELLSRNNIEHSINLVSTTIDDVPSDVTATPKRHVSARRCAHASCFASI